jgi:exodeoxyribonuclease-3
VGREPLLAQVVNACSPDVVVLQEAGYPEIVQRLAAATGMTAWGARRGHSVAFMSRLAVDHHEWHLPFPAKRPYLELVLAAGAFRLFGVHLTAVHSNWTEKRRLQELRGMLDAIARQERGFHVVAGDFNTLAPGERLETSRLPYRLRAFIWLTGRTIRWQTIQAMLDAGYVDGYKRLHPTEPGYTFPTWDPHVRLDYVFLPSAYRDRIREAQAASPEGAPVASASDHLPLSAEIELG